MNEPSSNARRMLLVGLAVTASLIAGGVVFFAVRAAFWPSDSARRTSPADDWPAIRITARYEGANAQSVEEAVTLPLEAQLAGLEGVETMESVSRQDSVTITLFFHRGTDMELVPVMACNRVALTQPVLPDTVKARG